MKPYQHTLFHILCFLSLISWNHLQAQSSDTKVYIVESSIQDPQGNPISEAKIYSNTAYAVSDALGKFKIEVLEGAKMVIKAPGHNEVTLPFDEAISQKMITLEKSSLLYGDDDKIQLAFRKTEKGNIVSAVSALETVGINKYDNNITVGGVVTGRTLGMLGSNSIRGIGIGINTADITGSGLFSGNALFIVDGLPRSIESLRMSEVESISVLKDVHSSILYGSAAVNGVILITTKRGKAYKQESNFSVNYGISSPKQLPNYLNSSEYMRYFNQARENDGLPAQFDEETIQNFTSGNPVRYPDVDYYSSEYLNNYKPYFDVLSEFSGGNDNARYYTNVGWYSEGSLLAYGEGANARNNIFNVRGNVDLKVNDWINTSIDGTALFVSDKNQRGNYWSSAANNRPHEFTPLLPISMIDPDNELLIARKNEVDGQYILGGNSNFISTPFGDGYSGGVLEAIRRRFSFNNRIDFDLNRLTKGLSFHTNISFDYFTSYDQTIANQYSVYEAIWDDTTDEIVGLKQHGIDARPGTQVVGNSFFRRRLGFYGLASYDRKFTEKHHVTGSLLGFGSMFKMQGDFQGVKQAHLGLQMGYTYDQKYMIDVSAAYVNSVKLPEGNRLGLSPAIGLGWMLSKEDFLASVQAIDFLKLKLSAGVINSDLPIGGFFYYDNRYGNSGSYNWYDGVRSRSGVRSNWSSNPNLGFSKRNEINFGLEGLFFNQFLGIEANVFYDLYNELIARPFTIYPSFYSDFIPYENFGADEYKGFELGLSLNKNFGPWNIEVRPNLLYVTSTRTKVDEVYNNDYQYRQGHPRDASFGLEALGLFQDQADIESSPIQSFGEVQPGDIKYKDQNGDGIIDSNDEVFLRRWQAPLSGGLQVKISYRNFTLFLLAEGRSGAKNFKEGSYFWIDGNDKYTEVVLNSWTPENKAAADYPRLSSQTNSNNFRRSSYWLYSTDYLRLNRLQLTYTMPSRISQALLMKEMNLFVNATDLIQWAEHTEIIDLAIGREPFYQTFSIGLKANF